MILEHDGLEQTGANEASRFHMINDKHHAYLVQQSQVKPLQGLSENYLIWQSLIKNLYTKTTACFEDEDEAPVAE